jgi:peptide/nickel transport system permease protein
MLKYILRRIAYAIPIALSVSIVCFMLVHIAPGDPIDAIVPPDTPKDVVEQVRKDYGLDKPLPIQYAVWLGHVLQGDLGRSIATRRPVAGDLMLAARKTFVLALTAAMFGFAVGIFLGSLAAFFKGTWIDRLAVSFAVGGVSIPHYWLGMVMVIFFSVLMNVFPAMGAGPGDWAWDWQHIQYLILPALTLSCTPIGLLTRTVRGIVSEILNQDFVTTLRGKGLRNRTLMAHVVKNAAPTILAVMGLQLGYLMGGSILVETIFSWPGTGSMLNAAIFRRDIPVIQGATLVLAMFFVMLNLIVDIMQTMIDPRIVRK